jgi:hypothetical protein
MIARRKFHRTVFCIAGIYNISWGAYSALDPQWLFRYAGMPLQNYPQIFACLGMVIGLYGLLYLEVARVPERGWLLAAIGLTGKLLGPIGLARLIWSGQWPLSTMLLSLTNDLIWWIPFSLYLYDAWPLFCRQLRTESSEREGAELPQTSRIHSVSLATNVNTPAKGER